MMKLNSELPTTQIEKPSEALDTIIEKASEALDTINGMGTTDTSLRNSAKTLPAECYSSGFVRGVRKLNLKGSLY